jgi:hypothetical protein
VLLTDSGFDWWLSELQIQNWKEESENKWGSVAAELLPRILSKEEEPMAMAILTSQNKRKHLLVTTTMLSHHHKLR